MQWGSKLRKFRKKNRVQIQELARAAGVSPGTISKVENDWSRLTDYLQVKIMRGYRKLAIDAEKLFSIDQEN